MFQRIILATLVLIVLAPQPGRSQPRPLVPPAWPILAQNVNKAPSCVFWTPQTTGKPEYFCAVIVADPSRDLDTSLCPASTSPNCAVGALRAVRIDPATGTVTVGPPGPTQSIILQQNPDSVTCAVIPPGFGHPQSVQCLYDSVERVGWNGTNWWSVTIGTNPTGIQGPGPDPGILVSSNLSCAPWIGSATTTCFGIETVFQNGLPSVYVVDQWTRDSGTHDWARASNNPLSPGLDPMGSTLPNTGPLVCSATAPGLFACILIANRKLFEVTGSTNPAADGVAWPPLVAGANEFVHSGVNTGQACVTFPSATSAPARADCFFGDGGLIPAPPPPLIPCEFGSHGQILRCQKGLPASWGLFWAPDDASRPVQIAMLEQFQLKATPSCIGWSAGQIECFYPNKALSDSVTSSETNANIFHVLSYNTDHGGNLLREELAFDLLRNGIVMNTGFWQESLGVAAPTTELGRVTVRGHSILAPVQNPKSLSSFACFKGPPFQSFCVAGLIDSRFATVNPPTTATIPTYRASRRLVFNLVGNPNGVAPQEPPTILKVSVPVGVRQPKH
ncbi:hypothetical protein SAMN05444169_3258 [Bradyrhizobium erythrophlei]|uniref:Uncharacterized protein n=1 Tax=Bradyrhizobium erythrophlei TaxID=1437360 RepID=A0A1M5L489_9BRAD|nr:hypothetical protein SAMN05444169_3258 [Bradyrhizobium erythrophlei]